MTHQVPGRFFWLNVFLAAMGAIAVRDGSTTIQAGFVCSQVMVQWGNFDKIILFHLLYYSIPINFNRWLLIGLNFIVF
jgi:hypothetical protein